MCSRFSEYQKPLSRSTVLCYSAISPWAIHFYLMFKAGFCLEWHKREETDANTHIPE